MQKSSKNARIYIDARARWDDELVAFQKVGDLPLLYHHLKNLKKAGLLKQTVVNIPQNYQQRVEEFCQAIGVEVEVTSDSDGIGPDNIQFRVGELFVPHMFKRLLRKGQRDLKSALLYTVNSREDLFNASEFVTRDRDFVLSRYLAMKVARKIAYALRNTRITPNQVTTLAGLCGVIATVFAAIGTYTYDVASAIFLFLALTLDLSDGYLARLKKQSSKFGAWYDTVMDEVMSFGIILGVSVGLARTHGIMIGFAVGAVWAMSFHLLLMSLWIARSLLPEPITAGSDELPVLVDRRPLLRKMLSWVKFVAYQPVQLDGKFYVIMLGLLLNLKLAMSIVMAGVTLYVFLRATQIKYRQHVVAA